MTTTPVPAGGRARHRRLGAVIGSVAAAGLALTACTSSASGPDAASATESLTLVTHDSFQLSDGILEQFEAETGISVRQVAAGDGGELANKLVLTQESPLGDVVFGIDNSFASRAIDAGVFEPYTSNAPAAADAAAYRADEAGSLTAIDVGDVCLNVDHAWFTEHGIAEPTSVTDLTRPEYRDLLVVPNAATSSPGLSFLLATVGRFGADGWQELWTQLQENGLTVADGWSDAYYTDFSGGGGGGSRPVVLSYASSPPATIPEGGDTPTTGALLDTCWRQVEYAGVLAGTANPEGAGRLVDFLLSDAVQADIPGSMYMYPVSSTVALPADWAQWAPLAPEPVRLTPSEIEAGRDGWVREWTEIVSG